MIPNVPLVQEGNVAGRHIDHVDIESFQSCEHRLDNRPPRFELFPLLSLRFTPDVLGKLRRCVKIRSREIQPLGEVKLTTVHESTSALVQDYVRHANVRLRRSLRQCGNAPAAGRDFHSRGPMRAGLLAPRFSQRPSARGRQLVTAYVQLLLVLACLRADSSRAHPQAASDSIRSPLHNSFRVPLER
jgi:hypothetical protein